MKTEEKGTWVESARVIVEKHTARRVDSQGRLLHDELRAYHGAILLDLFSASAMLQVYDLITDEKKQAFFRSLPVVPAQTLAFKLISKAKGA